MCSAQLSLFFSPFCFNTFLRNLHLASLSVQLVLPVFLKGISNPVNHVLHTSSADRTYLCECHLQKTWNRDFKFCWPGDEIHPHAWSLSSHFGDSSSAGMLRVHPGCFRWCCWVLLGNCRLFNDLCSFGERNIPHLARGSGAEHCWCYHHTSFHWSVESSLYSILWDTRINKLRIQDVVIIPVRLGGFLEMLSSFWVLQEEIVSSYLAKLLASCLLSERLVDLS